MRGSEIVMPQVYSTTAQFRCAYTGGMPPAELDPHALAAELRLVVGQLVRRVREDSPIPLGQLAVLGTLDRDGPKTTAELAAMQFVRHQSMARTVALLTESGFVARGAHATDGRKMVLAITDRGRATLEAERSRRVDWLADAIATALTPAERSRLAADVELLARLAREGER